MGHVTTKADAVSHVLSIHRELHKQLDAKPGDTIHVVTEGVLLLSAVLVWSLDYIERAIEGIEVSS